VAGCSEIAPWNMATDTAGQVQKQWHDQSKFPDKR